MIKAMFHILFNQLHIQQFMCMGGGRRKRWCRGEVLRGGGSGEGTEGWRIWRRYQRVEDLEEVPKGGGLGGGILRGGGSGEGTEGWGGTG